MTDWRPVGWLLLVLGLLNTTWGAFEVGTGGENSFLLVTGLGCLSIWLALHEEIEAAGTELGETDPEESP